MSAASPVASLSFSQVSVSAGCGSGASSCAAELMGWCEGMLAGCTLGADVVCRLGVAGAGCCWTACGAVAGADWTATGAGCGAGAAAVGSTSIST